MTKPDSITMNIINTLIGHDVSRRIYGTYYNVISKPDSNELHARMNILFLSKDYAITGKGDYYYEDEMSTMFDNVTGTIYKVSYPSEHHFRIGDRTYDIDSTAFGNDCLYSLSHPVNIEGRQYERKYLDDCNGFDQLYPFSHNDIAVIGNDPVLGKVEGRYLRESKDSVEGWAQDIFTLGKRNAHMENRSAENGQGWIYPYWWLKSVDVLSSPDANAQRIATLYNNDGEKPDNAKCLGMDGDWYHVEVYKDSDGKKLTTPKKGYVSRKQCGWTMLP